MKKLNNPRIKILNIENEYSNDELEAVIKKRNLNNIDNIDELFFKIHHIAQNKNNESYTAYAEVDIHIYNYLVNKKKVVLDWQTCKVITGYTVSVCYKCCGYRHEANKCPERDPSCKYCAQTHSSEKCPNKQNPKCINRIMRNTKYNSRLKINHYAYDKNCECYKSELEGTKIRTVGNGYL